MSSTQPLWIQIASDLHLEYYGENGPFPQDIIVPSAPVLALLGDIGYPMTRVYEQFLLFCADRFEHVIVLIGNHELYQTRIFSARQFVREELEESMIRICRQRRNLHLLNNSSIVIEGIKFVCSSLWSHVPETHRSAVEQSLGDYRAIYVQDTSAASPALGIMRPVTVHDTNNWHAESVCFIVRELEIAEQEGCACVVLTHHAPTFRGTSHPRFGIGESPIAPAFASDMHPVMRRFGRTIRIWAHGHTHFNNDRVLDGVRIVSNQRGYPKPVQEAVDYRPDFCIAISRAPKEPAEANAAGICVADGMASSADHADADNV